MISTIIFLYFFLYTFLLSASIKAVEETLTIDKVKQSCICSSLTGLIDDSTCYFGDCNLLNEKIFNLIESVLQTPYFSYFKVDIYKRCPFWTDNSQCGKTNCQILECNENELNEIYTILGLNKNIEKLGSGNEKCNSLEEFSKVDDLITKKQQSTISTILLYHEDDMKQKLKDGKYLKQSNQIIHEGTKNGESSKWYNLHRNPERYTGYGGNDANSVWKKIYTDFCFHPDGEEMNNLPVHLKLSKKNIPKMRKEKRLFYKMISAMHTSITIHLCHDYFDESTKSWNPNTKLFYERFSDEKTYGEGSARLENLYLTYLVLARSITKAKNLWEILSFSTGSSKDDLLVHSNLVKISNEISKLNPFNETGYFIKEKYDKVGNKNIEYYDIDLFEEFKKRFVLLNDIMSCVDCTKCRLWGHVQVKGLYAAIKILFSKQHKNQEEWETIVSLSQAEIVALLHTIHQFAQSIRFIPILDRYIPGLEKPKTEQKKNPWQVVTNIMSAQEF